jgi:hypothetical protein
LKAEDSCVVKTEKDVIPSRNIIEVGESVEFKCEQPNYILSREFFLDFYDLHSNFRYPASYLQAKIEAGKTRKQLH